MVICAFLLYSRDFIFCRTNPDAGVLRKRGRESFDAIIGSECVYREPILEALINTVDYHLKEGGMLHLVSARDRGCYLFFFHLMTKRGYTITTKELTPATLEETEDGWRSSELCFSRSEELSHGWFCEGQVYSEMNNLILVTCTKPMLIHKHQVHA